MSTGTESSDQSVVVAGAPRCRCPCRYQETSPGDCFETLPGPQDTQLEARWCDRPLHTGLPHAVRAVCSARYARPLRTGATSYRQHTNASTPPSVLTQDF